MFNGNESNFSVGTAISFDVSLESAYGNLMGFLKSENFLPQMAAIFGESEDLNKLQALADTWISGNFSQIPPIQIVPGNLMNGANGAFSELTGTIYLSSDYLSQNSSNPDPLTGGVTGVLLEEIGHFVDTVINPGSDTPGDEGELFAATLMGLPLSNAERYRINLEDDHSFITINNQLVPVEQSVTLPVITVMATDDSAIETSTGQPANFGQFTLVRTGNTAAALTLNYILGGTATNGKDYSKLDGKVTFTPGSSTAVVNVKPIDDNLLEGKETIILTLANGTGYTIGTVKKATITIANIDPRGLADFLWDKGNTVSQIGVNLKNRGFSLRTIADALDDGVTKSDGTGLNYTDVAIGLWNSGHSLDTRILADLLWDEGATEINIAQALNYGINRSLIQIASDIRYGVTKTDGSSPNYTSVAIGLWNSGLKIDSRVLADILWDTGATQSQIAQALNYGIGRNLLQIASDMKYGVTLSDGKSYLNYTDVAIGLWNSGLKTDSRVLADILWDTGATQSQIAQALNYGIGRNLLQIASDMKYGVTLSDGKSYLNYTDVAIGLWNSGLKTDSRVLADILWDTGATQSQIAQALNYGIGRNLLQIASDMKYGVTLSDGKSYLNYTDVAIGLWNSGLKTDSRVLADILWDTGATQSQIAQALNYGIGRNLLQIASDMKYGVTLSDGKSYLNYTDVAIGLWNSGLKIDSRVLADILWDIGATQSQIAQTMKYSNPDLNYRGFNLQTIADALDDGVTKSDGTGLNYIDVAIGLWNSGYSLDTRILADLLWDEGATVIEIAQAMKYGNQNFNYPGFDLQTIADALRYGVTKIDNTNLNYTTIARGLWNSGYSLDTRILADLLWDTGATQGEIAQALNFEIGRNLTQIANDMKYGVTLSNGKSFNYYDIALGLWESGLAVSTRDIARELQNIGANAVDTSQVLHYQLGASLEVIADALDDGATFSYRDIADGLWNSGYKFSDYRLSRLLRDEGAGFWETVEAVDAVATTYAQAVLVTIQGEIKDIINHVDQRITPIVKKLETFYEDNKSILWVATPILVISVEATKVIIKSIESGNVDPIVDTLKKIPVAGTAVGIMEGVINAVQGNEKDTLKSAIDSALAFYGVSTVITPSMVDFAVDIFWELKDKDYQGAISETLNNLGLPKKVAEIFVSVAWAMEKGNWETAVNTALTKVGFGNGKELVDIAWDIIDKNYQGVLKTGLELVGFNTLGIDQAKANAFINITVAIRDGNFNKAADYLISLAGSNAQQISQRNWVKDLRDGNSVNDRQAIQTGLSELGFKNAIQWVDVIWAVKDGKYVDALSGVLSLGNFKNTQDWVKIIDNLQKQNYLDALSTAFRLAGFQDGQSLAEAAIAVRNGNFIEAFYESFDLIEGGSDLKEAFKAIQDFNLQEFVTSMKNSAPLLLKILV
ncbi:Calx-beta domain-containing protein [Aliinostoc sp. HNIBRCY26]|uniref:Calx-beta domain-containing protein n=1 Tax=Aliinostoc sp. HNIBRCY26 TaxID=3418997 RepID=UPI003D068DD3